MLDIDFTEIWAMYQRISDLVSLACMVVGGVLVVSGVVIAFRFRGLEPYKSVAVVSSPPSTYQGMYRVHNPDVSGAAVARSRSYVAVSYVPYIVLGFPIFLSAIFGLAPLFLSIILTFAKELRSSVWSKIPAYMLCFLLAGSAPFILLILAALVFDISMERLRYSPAVNHLFNALILFTMSQYVDGEFARGSVVVSAAGLCALGLIRLAQRWLDSSPAM